MIIERETDSVTETTRIAWIVGIPGAGKTTVGQALVSLVGADAVLFDSDDPGAAGSSEKLASIVGCALAAGTRGVVVCCSVVAPTWHDGPIVWVDAPLAECVARKPWAYPGIALDGRQSGAPTAVAWSFSPPEGERVVRVFGRGTPVDKTAFHVRHELEKRWREPGGRTT